MNHNQHNHHFAPMQAAGAQHLIERVYREVKVMAIGGGSEEIMRDLAVRQMGL